MRERERNLGLDADDAAGRWLGEHEPKEPEPAPKSAGKSKLLHQFRKRQRES